MRHPFVSRNDQPAGKRPLLTFAGHGGYILPDGVVVTKQLTGQPT
jgi:hypothetical protein